MGRLKSAKITLLVLGTVAGLAFLQPASAEQNRLTLKECLDVALEKNVGVIAAENRYEQSKYSLLDAWGDVLPSASASASYGFSKDLKPRYLREFGVYYKDPGSKGYRTDLGFSMTLFDGGATWYRIKQSALDKTASRNDLRKALLDVAYNVKQAYYRLVAAIMLRKVQEDALARSKKQLEVTTSRFELGSASLSDKLKAQVTVASDSLTLLQRDNDIRTAEFALNLLMNRDAGLPIIPADTLAQVDINKNLDECLQAAMADNPGLKKSKADFDGSRVGVALARATWFPNVSASLGWDWSTTHTTDFLLDTLTGQPVSKPATYTSRSYSFGVRASYPLFDGFLKKTNYSRAKLLQTTARETYDADRNNLVSEVRQAYLDIQKARLQYEAARLAEESAQEDMKLQQERYRLGASSILELLNAQVSLTEAQYSRVVALWEVNRAVAAMAKATGQM